MFTQDVATLQGKHFHVEGAFNNPKPIRGDIPILIGGSGERKTLRFVAKYADGSNLFGDVERVKHLLGVLEGHCEDVGRDPAEITKTRMAQVYIAPTQRGGRRRSSRRSRASPPTRARRAQAFVGDPSRPRRAGAGVPRRRAGRHHDHRCPTARRRERQARRRDARRGDRTAPRDAGRGAADRRDPQPRPAQPQITYAYSLLAAEITARSGQARTGARSPPGPRARPAGRSAARTRSGSSRTGCTPSGELLHPLESIGRWLLRRGLFDPTSSAGRIMGRLHTPFDAVSWRATRSRAAT